MQNMSKEEICQVFSAAALKFRPPLSAGSYDILETRMVQQEDISNRPPQNIC
jgi:hypothetical protein